MNDGHHLVDLDGTLVTYESGDVDTKGPDYIGESIIPMVERVKEWLGNGERVKIFTARVWPIGTKAADQPFNQDRVKFAMKAKKAIDKWSKDTFGKVLPCTCIKTPEALDIWDDKAVGVVLNKGERADGEDL